MDSVHIDRDSVPCQPYRVRYHEPPDIRIIVPVQIVMQPCFPVEVLSSVAQVLLHPAVVLLLYRVTPRPDTRLPTRFSRHCPSSLPAHRSHPCENTVSGFGPLCPALSTRASGS